MTKHLIALVRLVGLCYHMIQKLVYLAEHFPRKKFITALDLFIEWAEKQPIPEAPRDHPAPPLDERNRFIVTEPDIDAGKWMQKKEASMRLGIVRSTLDVKLAAGELTAYYKKGDEHKERPRVWLLRAQVEEYFLTYTVRKGKEK